MTFNKILKKSSLLIISLFIYNNYSLAKETNGLPKQNFKKKSKVLINCQPPSSSIDLDINNVRTRLLNGGDMWWDLTTARYEVPKVEPGTGQVSRNILFTGAIWIGGIDDAGTLRTAGQTYRQNGSPGLDFWPGPIDTTSGNIIPEDCLAFDKHYKVNKEDVTNFINSGGDIPASIAEWPGNPLKPYQSKSLAPFVDVDGNGVYNPVNGLKGTSDYPDIIGDQSIWWVINDVGNTHTQYGGQPIGMEVQTLAFAFKSNIATNNMTFYRYKLINHGSNTLNDTYLAQWADPDLGNAADDYVGVDVGRSFGYCVNGDDNDETTAGYGEFPPSMGIDFFEGPFSDLNDGVDNDKDGTIDETTIVNGVLQTERIALAKFIHFTNSAPDGQDDPANDIELYRYLTGFWGDGTRLSYGGTGYDPASTNFADFSFPKDTDPNGRALWSECSEGNIPADRRFVESAGPFTLTPGAVNIITTGVVFATNTQKKPACPDGGLADLLAADDIAQRLFDNNFETADGPPIAQIGITELDKKLIISFFNTERTEEYNKIEPDDVSGLLFRYKFQGYKLYQVARSTVTAGDLSEDPELGVLIYQADIADGVGTIINKAYDSEFDNVQATVKVVGADQGINHTFEVTRDAFSNNNILSNNKQYFFLLIAYAYSDSAFSNVPDSVFASQYLEGINGGSGTVVGIPRISDPRFGGTILSNKTGVELKRLSGSGSGNNFLNFLNNDPSVALENSLALNPVYQSNQGPVKINVYDPFKVPNAEFEILFGDTINETIINGGDTTVVNKFIPGLDRWILINRTTNDTVFSDTTLIRYEQVIPQYGITVNIENLPAPGVNPDLNKNGFVGANITYKNNAKPWLNFVLDNDVPASDNNWIDELSSSSTTLDPNENYTGILNGSIAPYRLTSDVITKFKVTPAFEFTFAELPNVDIVFTSDVSKWSKCIVIETSSNPATAQGNQARLNLREGASIANTNFDTVTDGSQGRGYFPGYAVNPSTGERLNIFFGESSSEILNNGRDMRFNPTSSATTQGGKHFVYVSNTKYDECNALFTLLSPINAPSNTNKRNAYKTVAWATIPLSNSIDFLSSEAILSVRVNEPYKVFNANGGNNNFPYYSFNTNGVGASINNLDRAKTALDLIRAVPNPYYAFSDYEVSRVDNIVKFTNLPTKCSLTIYTTSGVYVTRLEKDDINRNFIDWDLLNDKNIPIASGTYIIHIKADGIGEKIIKWFGVIRPTDLTNF